MTETDWEQVKSLFSDALSQAPSRRIDFVETGCNGDPDLRKEVLSLLDAHEDADDYFDDVFASFAHGAGVVGLEGKRLGAYRVLSQLGEGGMGSVYLAERADDEFEQRVAIKILHIPVAGRALLKRFKIEKQALAKLEHPNISRLLDAGVSPDGAPFLVMEYVDGERIDEYCDEHRMSIANRLRLFMQVCDAVSFAHRHLIVHRDLKPPNVLVTKDGRAKLLDFGIARILSGEREEGVSITTILDDRPMTPSYAAPEQWLRTGPTTMTDVFSLGAILGELLSGAKVFRRADVDERRARPEQGIEPVQMAQRFGSGHDAHQPDDARDIAAARGTTNAALFKLLRGDLQNIVSKAMAAKPEDRYPTVDALREDIANYLNNKPVSARAPAFFYSARKWLARNKAPVAVASAFLGLALFAMYTTVRSARAISIERDKAEQVAALMAEVFDASDPSSGRGADITVREALDEGSDLVIASLEDQPQIRTNLSGMIGKLYSNLGLDQEAERFLREAYEGLGGIENADNLSSQDQELLVDVAQRLVDAQIAKGDYDEAWASLQDLREMALEVLGASHGSGLRVANSLTEISNLRGEVDAQLRLAREAVAMATSFPGMNFRYRAMAHNNLAAALYSAGDYEAAAERFREVLAIQAGGGLPDDHPNVIQVKSNLAGVYVTNKNTGAATKLYEEVIATGRDNRVAPETLSIALYGFGLIKLNGGDFAGGEALISEAIEQQLALKSNPDYVVTLQQYMLGLAKQVSGDRAGAEAVFRAALATAQSLFPGRSLTARLQSHLAALALDAGEVAAARELNVAANAIRDADTNVVAGHYAYTDAVAGRLAAQAGDIDRGRALMSDALALIEKTRGDKAPHAVIVRGWLEALTDN